MTHRLRFVAVGSDSRIYLASRGKFPPVCSLGNLRFDDVLPILHFEVTWINLGKVSGRKRKLILRQAVQRLLTDALKATFGDEKIRQRKKS
jgi:hypothetical protein